MMLRTRFDVFGATLLSALGVTQVFGCGGNTTVNAGSGGSDSIKTGAGGASASRAGASSGGSMPSNNGGSTPASGGSTPASGGAGGIGPSNAGTAGSVASAGGTGIAGNANRFPCLNPNDLGNGFEQCNGFKHRKQPHTCTSHVPRPEQQSTDSKCHFDSDCKEKPNGWCAPDPQGSGTLCMYGCVASSECAAGQLCDCVEPVGRCATADCTSDADCAPGFLCKGHDATGGCGVMAYTCQSAADACGSDSDCALTGHLSMCRFDAAKQSFQCIPGSCAAGRPFLIDGSPRLADLAMRSDWNACDLRPNLAALKPKLRAKLEEHWTRSALMEHASIAAFARFTLQLMTLGAPASLVELASSAMSDETKHAKACFAMASHFGSASIGPGHLAVARSLEDSSLAAIVINTIHEGCVGETVAAIEAREAAEHVQDSALRALLLEISEDETRHAELAYRFVQWALSQGGPELERAVCREFGALAARQTPAPSELDHTDGDLLRHGILPEAMRGALRAHAIAQLILPCARALLGANTVAADSNFSQEPRARDRALRS